MSCKSTGCRTFPSPAYRIFCLVIEWLFFASLIGVMVWGIVGCSTFPKGDPGPHPPWWNQKDLMNNGNGLSFLVFIAVLGIGAGVTAMVIMPGSDKIPAGIIAGSATILGVALFVKASLGLIPWIVGGTLVVGVLWLASKMFLRRARPAKPEAP